MHSQEQSFSSAFLWCEETTAVIIYISLQSQNQNLARVSDAQIFNDKLAGALQSLQSSQTCRKGKDKKQKVWRLTDGHPMKGGIYLLS